VDSTGTTAFFLTSFSWTSVGAGRGLPFLGPLRESRKALLAPLLFTAEGDQTLSAPLTRASFSPEEVFSQVFPRRGLRRLPDFSSPV